MYNEIPSYIRTSIDKTKQSRYNSIVGSISTLLRLLLSWRSVTYWLVFGVERYFDRWVAIKARLFLPRHPFVLIADNIEAWVLAIMCRDKRSEAWYRTSLHSFGALGSSPAGDGPFMY